MKRAEHRLVALAAGAAAAVLVYAVVRAVERGFFTEPNPTILIWSERSPFRWRAATALYLGGAAAFGGHALAARAPDAAARCLTAATLLAAAAILAVAVLSP